MGEDLPKKPQHAELCRREGHIEDPKKIPAHLYATTRMKCEAIRAHSSEHSVRKMCRAMELCESSYYQWLKGERRREKRRSLERELTEKVRETIR